MARLHTRRHGRSKSRKPVEFKAPAGAGNAELEQAIVAYAKQGMKSTAIGRQIKEKHKVGYLKPMLGKRLNVFLEEKGFKNEIPTDLLDLMRRAVNMRKHLGANHRDVHNTTRLQRVEAKIWRLGKYYRSSGKLAPDWKYDPAQAALIIKET